MAIHKKIKFNQSQEDAAAAFLTAAPDAKLESNKPKIYEKGIAKGHKRQVSITIAPELLRKVDERANAMGMGRSALISMALYSILKE